MLVLVSELCAFAHVVQFRRHQHVHMQKLTATHIWDTVLAMQRVRGTSRRVNRMGFCTCMLLKQDPSLTSKKTHSPPPAPRPVFTQPPILSVCPTCRTTFLDPHAILAIHRDQLAGAPIHIMAEYFKTFKYSILHVATNADQCVELLTACKPPSSESMMVLIKLLSYDLEYGATVLALSFCFNCTCIAHISCDRNGLRQ